MPSLRSGSAARRLPLGNRIAEQISVDHPRERETAQRFVLSEGASRPPFLLISLTGSMQGRGDSISGL
jgi:hypothetical protein